MRLRVTVAAVGEAPSERLDWGRVRDAVGVEAAVIIRESARHVSDWVRDAVRAHPSGIMRKCGGVEGEAPRDGIGKMARGP